jgi:hypothetical protein
MSLPNKNRIGLCNLKESFYPEFEYNYNGYWKLARNDIPDYAFDDL